MLVRAGSGMGTHRDVQVPSEQGQVHWWEFPEMGAERTRRDVFGWGKSFPCSFCWDEGCLENPVLTRVKSLQNQRKRPKSRICSSQIWEVTLAVPFSQVVNEEVRNSLCFLPVLILTPDLSSFRLLLLLWTTHQSWKERWYSRFSGEWAPGLRQQSWLWGGPTAVGARVADVGMMCRTPWCQKAD